MITAGGSDWAALLACVFRGNHFTSCFQVLGYSTVNELGIKLDSHNIKIATEFMNAGEYTNVNAATMFCAEISQNHSPASSIHKKALTNK